MKACTPAFCSSCASVGGPDFVSCCQGTDAAGCISTLLATAAGTSTGTGTSTSASITINSNDPNVIACRSAVRILNSCTSATPGFISMLGGAQASCLCYTSSGTETIYAPSVYDNLQSGCVNWAKTADTSDYALFASVEGLCTAVGDVRSLSAAATTTASGSGSATATATSQLSNGGAVSTRTASITSATSSSQTGSIIMTSSSSVAGAGAGPLPDHIEVSNDLLPQSVVLSIAISD